MHIGLARRSGSTRNHGFRRSSASPIFKQGPRASSSIQSVSRGTPLLPSTVSWGRFLHAVERRILVALFVFAGSVSLANARTYAEKIEGIPYPTDQAAWPK